MAETNAKDEREELLQELGEKALKELYKRAERGDVEANEGIEKLRRQGVTMKWEKRLLSKEQRDKIDAFIERTGLGKSPCEVCKTEYPNGAGWGGSPWGVDPFVVRTKGRGDTSSHFINIYCARCGNSRLFQAIALNKELSLGLDL